MSEEFERLVAEFEKFQSKIRNADEKFANIGQMQDDIVALEASATSGDRTVSVVAGAGGAVKDIRFTDEAMRQSPAALAGTVLATLHQAVAAAARQQAALVEQYYGDDMHLVEQVFEAQAEAFGTTVEELTATHEIDPDGGEPEDPEDGPVLHNAAPQPRPSRPSSSAADDFLRNIGHEEES